MLFRGVTKTKQKTQSTKSHTVVLLFSPHTLTTTGEMAEAKQLKRKQCPPTFEVGRLLAAEVTIEISM